MSVDIAPSEPELRALLGAYLRSRELTSVTRRSVREYLATVYTPGVLEALMPLARDVTDSLISELIAAQDDEVEPAAAAAANEPAVSLFAALPEPAAPVPPVAEPARNKPSGVAAAAAAAGRSKPKKISASRDDDDDDDDDADDADHNNNNNNDDDEDAAPRKKQLTKKKLIKREPERDDVSRNKNKNKNKTKSNDHDDDSRSGSDSDESQPEDRHGLSLADLFATDGDGDDDDGSDFDLGKDQKPKKGGAAKKAAFSDSDSEAAINALDINAALKPLKKTRKLKAVKEPKVPRKPKKEPKEPRKKKEPKKEPRKAKKRSSDGDRHANDDDDDDDDDDRDSVDDELSDAPRKKRTTKQRRSAAASGLSNDERAVLGNDADEDSSGEDALSGGEGGAHRARPEKQLSEFDQMLARLKRAPNSRKKPNDEAQRAWLIQAQQLIVLMDDASQADNDALLLREPAVARLAQLDHVRQTLGKKMLQTPFLEEDGLRAVKAWLDPLDPESGGRTLPVLPIRQTLLQFLDDLPIEKEHLKRSEVGKAVMVLSRHPNETAANKELCKRLINKWNRQIFNYVDKVTSPADRERALARRREQLLAAQAIPQQEKQPLDQEVAKYVESTNRVQLRAKIPQPSPLDYINRPVSDASVVALAAQFPQTKNVRTAAAPKREERSFDRFFASKAKAGQAVHAKKISIEGRGTGAYMFSD